jgi:type IV pilus assembly protein PilV
MTSLRVQKPPMQRVARYKAEQGFSLLEGMLAAVLLGTGLLAMSGMQAIALVKNVDANELTVISTVASDMMERIQFNRRNAIIYNGIDTRSVTNCNGINATAQPQANGDCLLWGTLVDRTQLQNVRGIVTVLDIGPAVLAQKNVTVTITWDGSMKSETTLKRPRSLTLNRVVAPE